MDDWNALKIVVDDRALMFYHLKRCQINFNPKVDSPKPVVVLCAGLGNSCCVYNVMGSRSLPNILANSGCDVWTFDLRGRDAISMKSKLRKDVNNQSKRECDHNLTDYAFLDALTCIKQILVATEARKIHYIGHSMGGMIGMALASHSMTQDLFHSVCALGSAIFLENTVWRHLRPIMPMVRAIGGIDMALHMKHTSWFLRSLPTALPVLGIEEIVASELNTGRQRTQEVLKSVFCFESSGVFEEMMIGMESCGLILSPTLHHFAAAFEASQDVEVALAADVLPVPLSPLRDEAIEMDAGDICKCLQRSKHNIFFDNGQNDRNLQASARNTSIASSLVFYRCLPDTSINGDTGNVYGDHRSPIEVMGQATSATMEICRTDDDAHRDEETFTADNKGDELELGCNRAPSGDTFMSKSHSLVGDSAIESHSLVGDTAIESCSLVGDSASESCSLVGDTASLLPGTIAANVPRPASLRRSASWWVKMCLPTLGFGAAALSVSLGDAPGSSVRASTKETQSGIHDSELQSDQSGSLVNTFAALSRRVLSVDGSVDWVSWLDSSEASRCRAGGAEGLEEARVVEGSGITSNAGGVEGLRITTNAGGVNVEGSGITTNDWTVGNDGAVDIEGGVEGEDEVPEWAGARICGTEQASRQSLGAAPCDRESLRAELDPSRAERLILKDHIGRAFRRFLLINGLNDLTIHVDDARRTFETICANASAANDEAVAEGKPFVDGAPLFFTVGVKPADLTVAKTVGSVIAATGGGGTGEVESSPEEGSRKSMSIGQCCTDETEEGEIAPVEKSGVDFQHGPVEDGGATGATGVGGGRRQGEAAKEGVEENKHNRFPYSHYDVIIGDDAPNTVFPLVISFIFANHGE